MYNPLLMIDFYKATHHEQYPAGMTKIYSPGTPRLSRLNDVDIVTYFGGQGFCKEFLIKAFNELFFSKSEEEVVSDYNRVLKSTLGPGAYSDEKIRNLHRLGYLPIAMYAVPEGMSTKIGVPQSVFVNTHPDFAWLTNTLETAFSSYIWHIQISAEVGKRYRKVVQKYHDMSCDQSVKVASLLGDFSMRGQHCPESAMTSSAAWCLSFLNTATVPAIMWLEDNYNCDCTKEPVAFGAISTEHSVMCSNFAVDGDEITQIKRLLTEIYPNHSFSMVSDSYDYWNLVNNLLPQCKEEIMNHNGCISIRGDSGDPVEIIAGKDIHKIEDDYEFSVLVDETGDWVSEYSGVEPNNEGLMKEVIIYAQYNSKLYKITAIPEVIKERGGWSDNNYYCFDYWSAVVEEIPYTSEIMGTVWALDQIFGSTLNSKGYKVLDPHVKAIYGDSITPQRCEEIYRRLTNKGYAINNVALGVGSFSFMCLETIDENGTHYNPYTRDTFGYAIKATYGEDKNGNPIMIHKQPKALSWKKSQRGCCIVASDGMSYTDGHTFEEAHGEGVDNLLQLVFKDGKMVRDMTLAEVRANMYPEGF